MKLRKLVSDVAFVFPNSLRSYLSQRSVYVFFFHEARASTVGQGEDTPRVVQYGPRDHCYVECLPIR